MKTAMMMCLLVLLPLASGFSQYRLQYRPLGQSVLHYWWDGKDVTTETIAGKRQTSSFGSHSVISIVSGSSEAGLTYDITFDSSVSTGRLLDGERMPTNLPQAGKTDQARVRSDGVVLSAKWLDPAFAKTKKAQALEIDPFFLKLPDNEVNVGAMWQNTKVDTDSVANHGFIVTRTNTIYTFADTEVVDGIACARIRITGQTSGFGPMFGYSVSDSVALSGEAFFNYTDGVLVKDSTDMDEVSEMIPADKSQPAIPARSIREYKLILLPSSEQNLVAQSPEVSAGKGQHEAAAPVRAATPEVVASAVPNVDTHIPRNGMKDPDAVALILAIPHYQDPDVPPVKFAGNDASVMRKYLINVLGYNPDNVLPHNPDEILTYGQMKTYVRKILPAYLKPDGRSDLFVYYSGHGAPSTTNHKAYLVPWDCDPNYVSDDNAYGTKQFYLDIERLNARIKIIVVDACFSGQAGNGKSLIRNASPALLKVNDPLIANPSTVIFQSSSAGQVANWYDSKRHGMFTYFFLKGLQGAADLNGDGKITAEELIRYINNPDNGLPYYSNRLYQRPQEAQMDGKGDIVIERIVR